MAFDAVLKNLIVVGEAGGVIKNYEENEGAECRDDEEEERKEKEGQVQVDWEEIIVMRNNIIHKYFLMGTDTQARSVWNLCMKLRNEVRQATSTRYPQ